MKKPVLHVHHHLGLGDHIICNGLIRSLVSSKAKVTLFVRENNFPRVQRMYYNDLRIEFAVIPMGADECAFVDTYVRSCGGDLLRVGFNQSQKSPNLNFDQVFYIYAGVPFNQRWDGFSLRRDLSEEQRVLSKLNPTREPYMFVHDDPSRGFSFDSPNSRGLKIIRNDPTEDIFSMIGVLENATEIHCMESSFRCLIESIPSITCPLFLHKMVRFANQPNPALSLGRKRWVEV